jgi:hypothetical protein
MGGEVTDFNAAAVELAGLPRQTNLAAQLAVEFRDYPRAATDAASLMLSN